MKTFNNKSILLAITSDNGFLDCFKDNLSFLNFSEIIIIKNNPFKYKSVKHKILNFIHKTIFSNKNYKKELIKKHDTNTKDQIKQLEQLNKKTDYSLSIRADLFDLSVIKKIVNTSKNAYLYQWDGLSRYPKIKDSLTLFKKFYVFDKNDLKPNQTYPITNFYFDCYKDIFKNRTPEFDMYYLGSFDSRIESLILICETLHNAGLKLNINIPCSKKQQKELKKYPYIKFPKGGLSYKENLKQISNCKIILDLNNPIHNGLSFRAFEALGYNKKLITTNQIIKDYDFYNENNIHLYKNKNDILEFLKTPLTTINNKIKHKYSFTNWLHYVLEQENCNPITFPN